MRFITCLITIASLIQVSAQSRSNDLLFAVDANHRQSGFLVGLGASNLFAQNEHEIEFLAIPESPDAGSYVGTFTPAGNLGFHIEAGMFWITDRSFFDYVDVTLAYKQQKGSEEMRALKQSNALDTLPDLLTGGGDFAQDMAALNVNFNKAIPLKDHFYVLQAIGADLEYRVINSAEYNFSYPGLVTTGPSETFNAHFHYKLGIGYKTSASSWLSFTAETPIQNIIPFNGIESRKTVFNSKYRPVLFTLRYQWLRKRPARECPTGAKKQNLKKKGKRSGSKSSAGQVR